jgi:hypothetical protein
MPDSFVMSTNLTEGSDSDLIIALRTGATGAGITGGAGGGAQPAVAMITALPNVRTTETT